MPIYQCIKRMMIAFKTEWEREREKIVIRCVLWLFFSSLNFILVRLECVEQNTTILQSNWFACSRFIDEFDDDEDSVGAEHHQSELNNLQQPKNTIVIIGIHEWWSFFLIKPNKIYSPNVWLNFVHILVSEESSLKTRTRVFPFMLQMVTI